MLFEFEFDFMGPVLHQICPYHSQVGVLSLGRITHHGFHACHIFTLPWRVSFLLLCFQNISDCTSSFICVLPDSVLSPKPYPLHYEAALQYEAAYVLGKRLGLTRLIRKCPVIAILCLSRKVTICYELSSSCLLF